MSRPQIIFDRNKKSLEMIEGDEFVEDHHKFVVNNSNTIQVITAPDLQKLHVKNNENGFVWNHKDRQKYLFFNWGINFCLFVIGFVWSHVIFKI